MLPWIVLLLLAVGIYLARNRFRALVGAGLGIALSHGGARRGPAVARGLLVGAVPAGAAPATASGFDIVVTYLRLGLRAVLVLGLVLALGGYLAGRSESAVRIRRVGGHPAARDPRGARRRRARSSRGSGRTCEGCASARWHSPSCRSCS